MKVLKEMQIEARALADLDFAFKVAPRAGFLDANDADLTAARPILQRLSTASGAEFNLESDGLPRKGGTLKPAEAWACFAADHDGKVIAESLHDKLLPHGIWLWTVGTIENALGGAGKGESAIQELELSIPAMTPDNLQRDMTEICRLLDWFM